MERKYCVTFDAQGIPLTWFKFEDEYDLLGKLEVKPNGYAYHDFFTRPQVAEWFVLDDDD